MDRHIYILYNNILQQVAYARLQYYVCNNLKSQYIKKKYFNKGRLNNFLYFIVKKSRCAELTRLIFKKYSHPFKTSQAYGKAECYINKLCWADWKYARVSFERI